jgi:hypothetical protein
VTASFDTPLDLSDAGSAYVWMNAYGGLPGATGYRATITLHSADGSSVTGTSDAFTPDRWNQLSADLTGWSGRSSITSIDVTFAGVGSGTPWQPRFQLDDLGWFAAG